MERRNFEFTTTRMTERRNIGDRNRTRCRLSREWTNYGLRGMIERSERKLSRRSNGGLVKKVLRTL